MRAEALGRKDGFGRELFLVSVSEPRALIGFEAPAAHFACLLVWDSKEAEGNDIDDVGGTLLSAGACYVCAWGNDCERLHDYVDCIIVDPHSSSSRALEVITTWHARDPLLGALWFVMFCACPADTFAEQCLACVLVVIGSTEYEAQLRGAALSMDREASPGE